MRNQQHRSGGTAFKRPYRLEAMMLLLAMLTTMMGRRSGGCGSEIGSWGSVVVVDAFSASVSSTPSSLSKSLPTGTANPTSLFASHFKAKEESSATTERRTGQEEDGSIILTYLEINGWLLTTNPGGDGAEGDGGLTILIDPCLEGPLDFGLPGGIYVGRKKTLPSTGLTQALPSPIDCLLLTQGLDDHAHVRTLKRLFELDPNVPIVAPPSARAALMEAGFLSGNDDGSSSSLSSSSRIRFVTHGEEVIVPPRVLNNNNSNNSRPASRPSVITGAAARIRATEGALVGPPWQRRENGYVIYPAKGYDDNKNNKGRSFPSIYIEPHVEFNEKELTQIAKSLGGGVDVVITPISGQTLPGFELVHGPKDTIRLLEALRPKCLVPMRNGNVDMTGPIAALVSEVGTDNDFQKQLAASSVAGITKHIIATPPGVDVEISSSTLMGGI